MYTGKLQRPTAVPYSSVALVAQQTEDSFDIVVTDGVQREQTLTFRTSNVLSIVQQLNWRLEQSLGSVAGVPLKVHMYVYIYIRISAANSVSKPCCSPCSDRRCSRLGRHRHS